jgi:hypothetical protein
VSGIPHRIASRHPLRPGQGNAPHGAIVYVLDDLHDDGLVRPRHQLMVNFGQAARKLRLNHTPPDGCDDP